MSDDPMAMADRISLVSRRFAAPPAILFAAHWQPDHLMRWFGPVGYPVTQCEVDFRVGGRWRMVMTGPDGVDGAPFGGTYLEIVPDRRIVYDNAFEDGQGGAMNLTHADRMVMTVTFAPAANGTLLTLSTLFATSAMKDEYLGVGMVEGIESGFDQLATLSQVMAAKG